MHFECIQRQQKSADTLGMVTTVQRFFRDLCGSAARYIYIYTVYTRYIYGIHIYEHSVKADTQFKPLPCIRGDLRGCATHKHFGLRHFVRNFLLSADPLSLSNLGGNPKPPMSKIIMLNQVILILRRFWDSLTLMCVCVWWDAVCHLDRDL